MGSDVNGDLLLPENVVGTVPDASARNREFGKCKTVRGDFRGKGFPFQLLGRFFCSERHLNSVRKTEKTRNTGHQRVYR